MTISKHKRMIWYLYGHSTTWYDIHIFFYLFPLTNMVRDLENCFLRSISDILFRCLGSLHTFHFTIDHWKSNDIQRYGHHRWTRVTILLGDSNTWLSFISMIKTLYFRKSLPRLSRPLTYSWLTSVVNVTGASPSWCSTS